MTSKRSLGFLVLPTLVAALAFAVYLPTLGAGWTDTDDVELIVEDAPFLSSEGAIQRAFSRPFFAQANRRSYYRPFVTASLVLDAPAGQPPSPRQYHLTNVLIHATASVLVHFFARALGSIRLAAAGAAALFAVHPVALQAVAWVPGRCDGLLAVFSLAALIAWMRFDRTGSKRALALHHALLAGALFSKEAAIAVPFVAFSYTLFVTKAVPRIREALVWVGWLLVLLLWFFARKSVVGPIDAKATTLAFIHNSPALLVGFGKLLVPLELDVLATVRDSSLVPGIVAICLLALGAFFVRGERRHRFVWAGLLLPLGVLVPALAVSDFLILDNRLYLPLAGIAVAASIAAEAALEKSKRAHTGWATSAALIIALAIWTVRRGHLFESPRAFSDAAVEGSPHLALAYLNRGAVSYREERLEEARRDFERALTEDPSQSVAHNNLGLIDLNTGVLDRAEIEFKKELAQNPKYSKAHFNLGLVYERTGRPELAREQFEIVVGLVPTDVDAWGGLFKYWAPRDAARADEVAKKMERLGVRFYSP